MSTGYWSNPPLNPVLEKKLITLIDHTACNWKYPTTQLLLYHCFAKSSKLSADFDIQGLGCNLGILEATCFLIICSSTFFSWSSDSFFSIHATLLSTLVFFSSNRETSYSSLDWVSSDLPQFSSLDSIWVSLVAFALILVFLPEWFPFVRKQMTLLTNSRSEIP